MITRWQGPSSYRRDNVVQNMIPKVPLVFVARFPSPFRIGLPTVSPGPAPMTTYATPFEVRCPGCGGSTGRMFASRFGEGT